MKNTVLIFSVVILVLVVGGIYFYQLSPSTRPPTSHEIEVGEMFIELREIMNQMVEEQAKQGITISVEEINVADTKWGTELNINLDVMGAIEGQGIIEKIQDKLKDKYPECFSKDSDCERYVEVDLKYNGEPDSRWMIREDFIDMAV